MSNVLILGSNGAVGGYLARLLQARGANVFGVTDNSANNALSALGIADAVVPVAPAEAAALAANLRDATIFAINDGSAEQAALVAEVLAAAAAAPTAPRLCHVADADTLRRNPALLQQTKRVAEYRRDNGRRAVNAILHAHDSRLGAADTLPARITAAALRAARSDATPILDLAETGPRDWGWTAESPSTLLNSSSAMLTSTSASNRHCTGHPSQPSIPTGSKPRPAGRQAHGVATWSAPCAKALPAALDADRLGVGSTVGILPYRFEPLTLQSLRPRCPEPKEKDAPVSGSAFVSHRTVGGA
jgi:NAD(P)-dependent dehydrogenase (short-subunit alcohol dehydrogenase family)